MEKFKYGCYLIGLNKMKIIPIIVEEQFDSYDKPYVACGIARTYNKENVIPLNEINNAISNSRTAKQLDARLRNLSLEFGIPLLVEEATHQIGFTKSSKAAHLSPDIDANGSYSMERRGYEESRNF